MKCSGNYAVALKPLMDAKKQGFHDNLFLELETYSGKDGSLDEAILQEMSAANVFFVLKTGEVVTPSLDRNTILPGVTRESVITLIEEFKEELQDAMEKSTGQRNVSVSSRDGKKGSPLSEIFPLPAFFSCTFVLAMFVFLMNLCLPLTTCSHRG